MRRRFSGSSFTPGTTGTRTQIAPCARGQGLEVRQDAVVRRSRPLDVRRLVHVLDVEQEEVRDRRRPKQNVPLRESARIHRRVDASAPQDLQACENEVGLVQRLATRKRDAAAEFS